MTTPDLQKELGLIADGLLEVQLRLDDEQVNAALARVVELERDVLELIGEVMRKREDEKVGNWTCICPPRHTSRGILVGTFLNATCPIHREKQ